MRDELRVDFREAISGTGWKPAEKTPLGWVRWPGPGESATLDLPVRVPHGARLEIRCQAAINPLLDPPPAAIRLDGPWNLSVNETPLRLSRTPTPSGILHWGAVPFDVDPGPGFTRLRFQVEWSATGRSPTPQNQGIAVSRVRIVPREGIVIRLRGQSSARVPLKL